MKKYYIFLFTLFLASFNLLADDGFAIDKKSRIESVYETYFERSIGQTFIGPLLEHDQRSQLNALTHLVLLVPNAPTGAPIQSFCDSATVADLIATPDPGGTITWYDAATGGNILNPGDALAQGDLVFAAQTVGGLESTDRLQVLVHFLNPRIVPANPTVCAGESIELTVEFDAPVIPNLIFIGQQIDKFYYYTELLKTWTSHENYIQLFGGHLASIHSEAENEFIITNTPSTTLIIGLNDFVSEGNFVWSDNSIVDYLNWAPGEPNGLTNEDISAIRTDGKWNDYNFNNQYKAVFQVTRNTSVVWSNNDTGVSTLITPVDNSVIEVEINIDGIVCVQTSIITVGVNPSAPSTIGDQTACALDPIQTLTASASVDAGETLTWYDTPSAGNVVVDPSLSVVGSVTYYAEASDNTTGCVSFSRTAVTLEILETATPIITNNTGTTELTCSVTEISLTANGGDSYSWSDGVSVVGTNALLLVSAPGTYTVTVTGANGCFDTDFVVITEDVALPAAPISGGDQTACSLDPVQTLTASASVNAGESITWYDASFAGNVVVDPSHSSVGSITYYAEASDDNTGCVSFSRTAVTLEILETPAPVITNNTGVSEL
ncbi:hypothetical protein N9Y02_07055, partial [Flavobacteriaceae bacterium]|nr:hypothetical protein [Flavobacteriaceae bacterium]